MCFLLLKTFRRCLVLYFISTNPSLISSALIRVPSGVSLWFQFKLTTVASRYHGNVDLLASWGRKETGLRQEAYHQATAPSPLSTRRGSMETQEGHIDIHTRTQRERELKGTDTTLALDILQRWSRSTWQVGNSITAWLHTCPHVILHLLHNILWQLQGLVLVLEAPNVSCGCLTAALIHSRGPKDVWNLAPFCSEATFGFSNTDKAFRVCMQLFRTNTTTVSGRFHFISVAEESSIPWN